MARPRRRPMMALSIWIIEATAIIVLSLVVMVVNEFRHHPRLDEATAE